MFSPFKLVVPLCVLRLFKLYAKEKHFTTSFQPLSIKNSFFCSFQNVTYLKINSDEVRPIGHDAVRLCLQLEWPKVVEITSPNSIEIIE